MVSPHSFLAQEISGRKALLRVVQRAKVAKKKVGSKTDEGWPKNGGFSDGFWRIKNPTPKYAKIDLSMSWT